MKDETKDKIKAWGQNLWTAIKSTPSVFIAGLVIGIVVCKIQLI